MRNSNRNLPKNGRRAKANQGVTPQREQEESELVVVGECEQHETQTRIPTPQEEQVWAQRVLEITSQLEKDYHSKPMVDRTGKPTLSYRESLPPLLQAAARWKHTTTAAHLE
jgi:hypothetical protein